MGVRWAGHRSADGPAGGERLPVLVAAPSELCSFAREWRPLEAEESAVRGGVRVHGVDVVALGASRMAERSGVREPGAADVGGVADLGGERAPVGCRDDRRAVADDGEGVSCPLM